MNDHASTTYAALRRITFGLCCLVCASLVGATVTAQDDTTQIIDPALDTMQAPVVAAPPTSLIVEDHKYDDGDQLDLEWVPSIHDQPGQARVLTYLVYRGTNGSDLKEIAVLPAGTNNYSDQGLHRDSTYVYQVAAVSVSGDEFLSNPTQATQPLREWINFDRTYLFVIGLIISAAVIFFVETAKRGKKLFVRKIAGLEAIDEAVGRATEMGRPVLFIPGIHDLDDVQTLAALTILGRISRTIADYDSRIFMPVSRSLVMTAARETIKASYMSAGRPDAYTDDMVNYVTDEQFGYVAAVDGIMVREKPATIFLLGAFFAESLILAETGNSIGAIQIAGTARPAQLPFFIAACDFTLIGEELFAASAYLSGEPRQLGSLKGQDVGKGIAMVAIIIGVIAVTFAEAWPDSMGVMQEIENFMRMIFETQ